MEVRPHFTAVGAMILSIKVIRRRGITLIFAALILFVLPNLAVGGADYLYADWTTVYRNVTANRAEDNSDLQGYIYIALSVFGEMAITWIVCQDKRGTLINITSGVVASLRALPMALAVSAIYYIAVFLGCFLLIVPGILLMVRWCIACQTLVVERTGIFASLGRSRDLTKGHRWTVFGILSILVLSEILCSILCLSYNQVMTFIGGGTIAHFIALVGCLTVETLSFVFSSTVGGILYSELRRCSGIEFSVQAASS